MMTAHRVLLTVSRLILAVIAGRWSDIGSAERYTQRLYQRELLDEVLTDIGGEG